MTRFYRVIMWPSHRSTGRGQTSNVNDVGTQYRSGIYVLDQAQRLAADSSLESYQQSLKRAGHDAITTEIVDAPEFYYAEDYHQQYLAKNPGGYCGIGGSGVAFEAS